MTYLRDETENSNQDEKSEPLPACRYHKRLFGCDEPENPQVIKRSGRHRMKFLRDGSEYHTYRGELNHCMKWRCPCADCSNRDICMRPLSHEDQVDF
jgi:hypothetical protein